MPRRDPCLQAATASGGWRYGPQRNRCSNPHWLRHWRFEV